MSRAKFMQCLLLSVHKRSQDSASARSSTASALSMKYYALLPKVFKFEYPELLTIFKENRIILINDSNFSSLQFFGRGEIEITEVILRVNSTAASNSLSLIVEDTNVQFVEQHVFSNSTVDINSFSKTAKVYPAIDDSNVNVMKRILSKRKGICYRHPSGESLLHLAARRGHGTHVQIILEHGLNVNSKCNDGLTPLFAAVNGGHCDVVDILIQNGADVGSSTSNKLTSLHVAVEKRQADIVETLLLNGADIESKNERGLTALHVAAKGGHRRIVEILLQNNADIESKTDLGSTALFVAVKKDYWNIVEVLLRNGADRDTRNNAGSTALHVAVKRGHLDMVEVLLENGADVDCRNRNGRTPLFIAAIKGRLDIVKALLSYGACPNVKLIDGRFAVEDFAIEEHHQTFQCLLESCFRDPEILEETGAFGRFRKIKKWFESPFGFTWQYIYVRHIVKVIGVNLYPLTPLAQLSGKDKDDFMEECKVEVERMKRLTIGNTNISFFDVLTKDIPHVAQYLKNRNVAQILSSDNLNHTFPKYAGILKCQFRKGNQRKLASAEGLKIIHNVSSLFGKLPREIKEKILDYLSVRDILILKHAQAPSN